MPMLHMRTAKGVMEAIRAEDPGTELTERYVRQLIKTGAVPVVEIGTKKLVAVEAVMAYLTAGGSLPSYERAPSSGGIQPVPER